MTQKHYVYAHKRADTGELFYIGKGVGKRANSRQGRTEWWRRIVAKHGLQVEVLEYFDTNEEACAREIDLIAEHRSVLCNIQAGGDVTCELPGVYAGWRRDALRDMQREQSRLRAELARVNAEVKRLRDEIWGAGETVSATFRLAHHLPPIKRASAQQ